jgi:hypothetical protein
MACWGLEAGNLGVYDTDPDGSTSARVKASDVKEEIMRLESWIAAPCNLIRAEYAFDERTGQLTQGGVSVTPEYLVAAAKTYLEEYRSKLRASIDRLQVALQKRDAKPEGAK